MAAEVTTVVEVRKSIEPYTGTNGADIVAAIPGATLVSEAGSILTVGYNQQEYPLAVGDVIQFRESGEIVDVFYPLGGILHDQVYRPLVTTADLAALASRVSDLETAQDTAQSQLGALEALGVKWSHGTAALAAGLISAGTRSFSITLDEPVDQSVAPVLLVQGAQLVGGHVVASWSYADSTTITGTYSSLALASAATLHAYVPYLG